MGIRDGDLAVGVALGAVIPLVAGAALVVVRAGDSPLESAAQTEPLIGTIELAQRRDDSNVSISLQAAQTVSLTTQADGTVTAFPLAPGDVVDSGATVMRVDAYDVVAYTSGAPLYRDVMRGQTGEDISTAQSVLAAWGFDPGAVDGKAGWRTERAIEAFNEAHGRGKDNPVLSLASLMWIGAGPASVGEAAARVGDRVTPGSAVFTTAEGLAHITVTETPGMPTDVPLELQVGDATVPYEPGSARVTDPDAVAAIADALGTLTEGVATVRRAEPVEVATVPSPAVVTDDSGRVCLFGAVDGPPVPVTPVGGSLGTIDLDPSLAGQPVLLNPREVREDLTCGS